MKQRKYTLLEIRNLCTAKYQLDDSITTCYKLSKIFSDESIDLLEYLEEFYICKDQTFFGSNEVDSTSLLYFLIQEYKNKVEKNDKLHDLKSLSSVLYEERIMRNLTSTIDQLVEMLLDLENIDMKFHNYNDFLFYLIEPIK